jgi:NTE family protein
MTSPSTISPRPANALPTLREWLEGRPLLDGGILDRPGLAGMPEGARLFYHHLAARSPWRRRESAALTVPERQGMTALVITSLPRVGPFRLLEGARAFEIARRAAREALGEPVEGREVRVLGSP